VEVEMEGEAGGVRVLKICVYGACCNEARQNELVTLSSSSSSFFTFSFSTGAFINIVGVKIQD
jgi:hypothetical protein